MFMPINSIPCFFFMLIYIKMFYPLIRFTMTLIKIKQDSCGNVVRLALYFGPTESSETQ